MTTALVLGGGFAGVLTAMVLTRHVDDVVLVEAGRYPANPRVRPGLPQGRHNHVLVTGGARALETLLPGAVEALLARGAQRRGLTDGALILGSGGWFHNHETGAYLISCSRWLTDHIVRQRALSGGAVSVREGTRVLRLAGDASRVTGAVVGRPDGRAETIPADVVVDATGRWSRAGRWLADLGAPPVQEATVDAGVAYSTRLYRAPADLAATIPAVMVHPRPADGHSHGVTLFPIEDRQWIVTLTCSGNGRPPADDRRFTERVRALGSPIVADLLNAAEPIDRVRPFRATANRRRYFELSRRPDGFLVVGDALVAVNPVYSHGMSIAALSALTLAGELERRGVEPSVFVDIQAAIAAVAERSWQMSTDGDRRTPRTNGGLPRGPAGVPALPGSRVLLTAMFRAQALMSPGGAVNGSLPGEMTKDPAPPLGTEDAIAQYPELSVWWRSKRRRTSRVPRKSVGVPV